MGRIKGVGQQHDCSVAECCQGPRQGVGKRPRLLLLCPCLDLHLAHRHTTVASTSHASWRISTSSSLTWPLISDMPAPCVSFLWLAYKGRQSTNSLGLGCKLAAPVARQVQDGMPLLSTPSNRTALLSLQHLSPPPWRCVPPQHSLVAVLCSARVGSH